MPKRIEGVRRPRHATEPPAPSAFEKAAVNHSMPGKNGIEKRYPGEQNDRAAAVITSAGNEHGKPGCSEQGK